MAVAAVGFTAVPVVGFGADGPGDADQSATDVTTTGFLVLLDGRSGRTVILPRPDRQWVPCGFGVVFGGRGRFGR